MIISPPRGIGNFAVQNRGAAGGNQFAGKSRRQEYDVRIGQRVPLIAAGQHRFAVQPLQPGDAGCGDRQLHLAAGVQR
jgi:hypothetical protein